MECTGKAPNHIQMKVNEAIANIPKEFKIGKIQASYTVKKYLGGIHNGIPVKYSINLPMDAIYIQE